MSRFLALDCETIWFEPGNMAPPLICVSWYNGTESGIFHWTEAEKKLISIFKRCSKEAPLVFHNAPYDLAVFANQFPSLMPMIFDALDNNAIRDTRIRERLINIAEGTLKINKYSLQTLTQKYFSVNLDKTTWRTGYAAFQNVPLDQWPDGAKQYAIDDATYTGKLYLEQEKNKLAPQVFVDECNQNKYAFALRLVSNHGIMTDKKAIDKLKADTLALIGKIKPDLLKSGLVRANDTRNTKLAQQMMLESWPNCPLTDTGKPCTDEEACEASGNPLLMKLSQYRQAQTLLSKDVESLEKGTEKPLHTNFESLLETGRTSSSGPNIQNPRRMPGVRECYVPRPGTVFISCDYSMAELHTLAQVCYTLFGYSRLREKLNEGFDPHLDFASQLLNISYEEAVNKYKQGDSEVEEARQFGKILNFGKPGGLGAKRLTEFAKIYGVSITEQQAKKLTERWLDAWPEMREYFNWINGITGRGKGNIVQLYSNRLRGNVSYCEACNSFFQGLAADAAKDATYEVIRACYLLKDSPLFGCRIVNFIHDQIIMEAPEDKVDACAKELQKIMETTFNKWIPDLHIKAEPCAMFQWTKLAKSCYNEKGELIPWRKDGYKT